MDSKNKKKYKILEFQYPLGKKEDDDTSYKFKDYQLEKKYLISKSDYEMGLKYIEGEIDNLERKIHYYYNYDDFIRNKSEKNFVLVNKNFLESLDIYNNKKFNKYYVGYFTSGKKQFIYFEDEYIIEIGEKKEEDEENSSDKKDKISNTKKKNESNDQQDILRILILLYANEKNFLKLLNSSIEDEYNFKDYYLIDSDFIETFKEENNYENIIEIFKQFDLNYSYNGFYMNLEKIVKIKELQKIKTNPKKYDAEELYPEITNKLKKIKDIECFDGFIFVPKNLFNILYNNADKLKNFQKEDFKFKIQVGDGILFLQEKNSPSTFYLYRYFDNKFKLFYIFEYSIEPYFYEEVKLYIKEKGIINYIIKRNLITNTNLEKFSDIKGDKGLKLGKYINVEKIESNEINKFKMEEKSKKFKNYVYAINEFASNKNKLYDNEIEILTNKYITKQIKENKLNCIEAQIILYEDLNNLKQKLFFKDINKLSTYAGKRNFKKEEEDLINNIYNFKEDDLIDFTKNIKIYNPDDIEKEKNKNNIYSIINIETLNMITEVTNIYKEESYYFINNNRYYILFLQNKKIYEITNYNPISDNFKLKEYISLKEENTIIDDENKQINHKAFLKNIKDLIKEENEIKEKINSNFAKSHKMDKYYLINTKWIHEFKNQFNYDYISKNPNKKVEKLLDKIKQAEITSLLSDINNLNPNDLEKDVDFEIISESLFQSILENINSTKNGLKLKSDNLFQISFGDSKIIIKQKDKNEYLIYELNESQKFTLVYKLKLDKDKTLEDIFNNCDSFKNFLNNQKLNLKSTKEQEIYIKTGGKRKELIKIGEFICVNPGIKDQDQQGNENEDNENEDEEEEEKEEFPVHCLGLENIGATCYMNATIQCLCHINYLKDYFLNKDLITEATKNKRFNY